MLIETLDPAELVQVGPDRTLIVFTTPGAFDPLLQRIRAEVAAFDGDATTPDGREQIAAMARKVAKTRTLIEGAGKKLADVQKDIPRKIDATRKAVRDALDQLQADVRRPLTNWEVREELRIDQHRLSIEFLQEALALGSCEAAVLKQRLAAVEAVEVDGSCEEFEDAYRQAKAAAIAFLPLAITAAATREADAAELARLRAADDERRRQDRDADIARETEERIRRDEAVHARRAAEEIAAREADKTHRARVNREAMAGLIAGGLGEEWAKRVVEMICRREVPHVAITY